MGENVSSGAAAGPVGAGAAAGIGAGAAEGIAAGAVVGIAAGVAAGVYAVLSRRTDGAWLRTNHAGRTVTLYAGPAAVLAPADLGERAMLGDTGAHGLGAALGIALARRGGRTGRVALAAGLVAAAANGDRISGLARRASKVLRRVAGAAGA